jgi:hypothetical protein
MELRIVNAYDKKYKIPDSFTPELAKLIYDEAK